MMVIFLKQTFVTLKVGFFFENSKFPFAQNTDTSMSFTFTFAWLIVDTDGLCLVLAVICLHTDEVGVCSLIEARPKGQHMLVGLI